MNLILRQQTLSFISITCSTPINQSETASQAARPMILIFSFYVLYSTLLHLPPLRFHWVGGCWDRAQCRSMKVWYIMGRTAYSSAVCFQKLRFYFFFKNLLMSHENNKTKFATTAHGSRTSLFVIYLPVSQFYLWFWTFLSAHLRTFSHFFNSMYHTSTLRTVATLADDLISRLDLLQNECSLKKWTFSLFLNFHIHTKTLKFFNKL